MLHDARIVAFVPSTDIERARAFYADTLGLPLIHADDFGCQFPGLRIARVDALSPAGSTVAGWTVEDIDSCVTSLAAAGVTFLRFEGMEQDALGIWNAPGGDRVAWFHDPDGNTLSVTAPAS